MIYSLLVACSAEESISNGTTPIHVTREETAKKGKPIDLHCIVAPRGEGVKIEWTAEKNTIKADVNGINIIFFIKILELSLYQTV